MNKRSTIFNHRDANPVPKLDSPWPGTVLLGNPQTVTLNGYESEDGTILMGTWISTPGTWAIDYNDWEYCHILEGRCVITPDGGDSIELKANDVFIIEPGLKGTWKVCETIRKYYIFKLK